jgi:hypothetical protein
MADEFREGTARTPPAMKAFATALSRDLPNALSKATAIAVQTRALAGRKRPRTKR